MLVWEDNVSDKTTPTIRTAQQPSREARAMASSPLPNQSKPPAVATATVSAVVDQASAKDARHTSSKDTRRVSAADKRIINGQTDVNQLVPLQVQVGLGKVPRHLRQSLDAARGEHVA